VTIASLSELEQSIRNVPDFPKPGIQFKDITPVLADGRLFNSTIHHLLSDIPAGSVDKIVGIDARGFIFGAAAAHRLGVGFVPVRKKGKLPWETHEQSYDLEYGSNAVAVHTDAVAPGHGRHRGCGPPVAEPFGCQDRRCSLYDRTGLLGRA
jgi:adenine phosphoribosyltransferase